MSLAGPFCVSKTNLSTTTSSCNQTLSTIHTISKMNRVAIDLSRVCYRDHLVFDDYSNVVYLAGLQEWLDPVHNMSDVLVQLGMGTDMYWNIVLASPLKQPFSKV